jgi:TPR repeat protein
MFDWHTKMKDVSYCLYSIMGDEKDQDVKSLFSMAREYVSEKNYSLAAQCYQNAAETGCASSQNNLGNMYYNGYGVVKNYATAVDWYKKSADQGNVMAWTNLGRMYAHGLGVEKNRDTATTYFLKAASQGYYKAHIRIGRMCQKVKTYSSAIESFQKAIDLGAQGKYLDISHRQIIKCKILQKHYAEALFMIMSAEQQGIDMSICKKELSETVDSLGMIQLYMQLQQQYATLERDHRQLHRVVEHLKVCPAETYKEAMVDFETAAKNGVV